MTDLNKKLIWKYIDYFMDKSEWNEEHIEEYFIDCLKLKITQYFNFVEEPIKCFLRFNDYWGYDTISLKEIINFISEEPLCRYTYEEIYFPFINKYLKEDDLKKGDKIYYKLESDDFTREESLIEGKITKINFNEDTICFKNPNSNFKGKKQRLFIIKLKF